MAVLNAVEADGSEKAPKKNTNQSRRTVDWWVFSESGVINN
jgi:hypothetical protein